ncbi:kelch-like protein 10 [Diachasma alloeum]|uniref:kelch-like protein 10 n=1 Tax=Diachasma alloeum TaxID=454923 RepID=UPI0007384F2B|nr:kelch-like protein 10 [Diachasma alloeum]
MEVDSSEKSREGTSDNDERMVVEYGGRCMSTQAMQSLYDLRQNNLFCDAVVHLEDGGVFSIHRAILSACSSYFRTLFTTSFYTEEKTEVRLPGVTSEIMELILKYAYLRSLEVTHDNVCDLLITSNYLCIMGIIKLCCTYLKNNLTPENCISVMRFGKEHFCSELESDAHTFVMRNFIDVAQRNEEILELSIDKLLPLVGADELNVKSEEIVWELVIKWIDHKPEERRQHIVELMKTIRLGLLDTQYFLERVKEHHYVAGVETCRPIIIETLTFLYDLEMITQKDGELATPEIARPRVPHEILFTIGGWRANKTTSAIETYDTRADRWIPVAEMDPIGGRAYHGLAAIGFNIYVIGGFSSGLQNATNINTKSYFNSCRCFNAVTKVWREVAPMNARRCYVSVAVLNDVIYAMGGYDGHFRLNTAERYNYKENQWSLIASMNRQRSDASATTLNNKIYIVGGFNGHECLSTAEVYNPDTNQWTMIASMRSRRSGLSCISYHGYVYAIGGFAGNARKKSGEKYDPSTNRWQHIPEMYNPRSNFAIAVIDDMIFAIGGYNGMSTMFHVECYDERTNEWYEATDMNFFRSGLAACVIMGLPNVCDYIHKHRDRLMEEKRQKLIALETQRNQQQYSQFPQDHENFFSNPILTVTGVNLYSDANNNSLV